MRVCLFACVHANQTLHAHQVKTARMEGKEELRKELEDKLKQPSRKEVLDEMLQVKEVLQLGASPSPTPTEQMMSQ